MFFTRDIEISIELLKELKKHEKEPIKVAYFVEQLNTTQSYLDQIVNKLKKGGLIVVKRGPNGGINRISKSIKVNEILKIFGKYPDIIESNKETKEIYLKIIGILDTHTI